MVAIKETDMALDILFTSDVGLLSLFTIVFIICMAIFILAFVRSRIRQEERQQQEIKLDLES
ncbi:MAG: DUF3149 domain-containing protein [Burkholderiaceae bacterium]|jgi:hypothetical protein|nr:DUF3149 domain-containing protein [Burkholderiaceae bacterium]